MQHNNIQFRIIAAPADKIKWISIISSSRSAVQFEDLDENLAQAEKPLWKTGIFWKIAIPWIVAIILIVLGGAFLASSQGLVRIRPKIFFQQGSKYQHL